jgi:protein-disulfide isomerase/predicted double-glycine peptidase/uncharacterized membrane protein
LYLTLIKYLILSMLSLKKQHNTDTIVKKLLQYLTININSETISEELEKHPDYPSLLAISDVLNNFNIDNSAYSIEFSSLKDVPCPFIAHTSPDNEFVLINSVAGDHVTLWDDKRNDYKLAILDFGKIFTGIVLTVEKDADLKRYNNNKAWTDILSPFRATFAIICLLAAFVAVIIFNTGYFANLSWPLLSLTLFKTLGLAASALLLVQSIDRNNTLVQKLCGVKNNKTGCSGILSSNAATVFKGLTWSEVGFFYFAGTWFALLFGGGSLATLKVVALLNIISLPYTFYSVYYQARIARQWCVLCCSVQAVLWLEFISLALVPGIIEKHIQINMGGGVTLFTCLLFPIFLWMLLKPVFLKAQQLSAHKQQLRNFKYNVDLFNHLLTAQPKFVLPEEYWSILLGNTEANNVLTMVSNPYCDPCAKTHSILDEWLSNRDDLQVRIVFAVSNFEGDDATAVARHFMMLNKLHDKTVVKEALNDWYAQKRKNYSTWKKDYEVELKNHEFNQVEKQKAWCQLAEITSTPTVLVNGYRLPNPYQIADLKYMLY